MATHIGIGFSQETNTSRAARDAALQAKTQTKQHIIDLAVVFSTVHHNPLETLHIIRQTLNQPRTVGCSTAGIILAESIEMRGIAVLAITSEEIKFGIGRASDITPETMRTAGAELARTTITDFGNKRRQAFIFFTDGLLENNSRLVQGIQEIFGKIFPVIGAGSSDDFHFKETYQFFQDKPLRKSATALLIGGQTHIGLGNKHGWKPLGKPRFATKTDGHIIHTIDNKRASSIYEEYLGPAWQEPRPIETMRATLLSYPLGIQIEGEKEYLLRYAVDINNNGSIICQGNVPEGSEVHMMIGNKDFCKQAAVEAACEVRDALLGKQPKLIVLFESLSRHKILGRSAIQEIHDIQEILGNTTPIIGMYSYGEIAPLKALRHMGESYVQNETIVILAIA